MVMMWEVIKMLKDRGNIGLGCGGLGGRGDYDQRNATAGWSGLIVIYPERCTGVWDYDPKLCFMRVVFMAVLFLFIV